MAETEEELKSLLMKVKEESEKAGLKLNIKKSKIMASGPITSQQPDGKTMETVTDFIFLGSKITADDNCSHEIKRHLLLGRKAMTNLCESVSLTQSCLTLCDTMDWSSPGFSVHGILQARILEWVAMTNLDSVLKSRDITLQTKVFIAKAMVFLVVVYECESWTIKKAEQQRIDAFEQWCWKRLLRIPWSLHLKQGD